MPVKYFHIIAGPNGAGKSSTSKYLLPDLTVYDGDIEVARIRHESPSYASDEFIYESLRNVFNTKKKEAIETGQSFAMETNFSASRTDLNDLIEEFRSNNYKIKLFYFGLDSFEESAYRVAIRVAKGGHHIQLSSIEYNYHSGIKMLMHSLD